MLEQHSNERDYIAVLSGFKDAVSHRQPLVNSEQTCHICDATTPFPLQVMPPGLQQFITEGAASLNCPHDYFAVPMLSIGSVAIGASRRARPKPDWAEYPTIWTIVVGESGSRKSPALAMVKQPLDDRQAYYARAYESRLSSDEDTDAYMQQVYSTDFTIEAMAEALKQNRRGIILVGDEATGWIQSFNQYRNGRGSDKQKILSLWSNQPMVINRKGKQVHIPDPFLSITGNIQPEVMYKMRNGFTTEDGFAQRFLFSYPPSIPIKRTESVLSLSARSTWDSAISRLFDLQMNDNQPTFSDFNAQARNAFFTWQDEHYDEYNSGSLSSTYKGVWTKLETYVVRLSLVMQGLRHSVGEADIREVDEVSVLSAIELIKYFKGQAHKVYELLVTSSERTNVEEAIAFAQTLDGIVTSRDMMRKRLVQTPAEAEILFKRMQESGYGITSEGPRGGLRFQLGSAN